MEPYFINKGYQLTSTRLFQNESFPQLHEFDWLLVMGGPMGVNDELQYPWMREEKKFIKSSIDSGKIVMGICLGAQLIADVLGAKVYKNRHREIGWFPLHVSEQVDNTILQDVFPKEIDVFHWHGDTFDIPETGVLLTSSDACRNQGFIVGDWIVGLQFHLETTFDSARALVENCRNELDGSEFVQDENELLTDDGRFQRINEIMIKILERLEANHA